jgi:hypothetical protein
MPGVRFLRVVPVRDNLSWVVNRVGQSHCSWEKRAPDIIHNMSVDRSAGPYLVSLQANQWNSRERHRSINSRLLGLPSPYHWHVIGTFNTCSRGPTEWSLIDTSGGYNLGGVGLCCWPKPPNGRRQATRESGGPEPLFVSPAAHTCPEVGVRWACHLTYTWSGRCSMCFN